MAKIQPLKTGCCPPLPIQDKTLRTRWLLCEQEELLKCNDERVVEQEPNCTQEPSEKPKHMMSEPMLDLSKDHTLRQQEWSHVLSWHCEKM